MIEANIELIVAGAPVGRGNIILIGNIAVGRRVERGDGKAGWIQIVARNFQVREWRAGSGIDGNQAALREIADAFGQRRHIGDLGDAGIVAGALIIGEKEGPVMHYRSAQSASKLIALVLRGGRIGWRKIVARIENGVAEELISGAMKLVAAGAQHDAHLPAAVASEGGVVGAG